eukprot:scaffold2153_cov131-Cylindrotheca_fusiformis.AAC.6
MTSSLEESLGELNIVGNKEENDTNNKKQTGASTEMVYSVSSLSNSSNNNNKAMEDLFDRIQSTWIKKKKKDRQLWLQRPIVEQVGKTLSENVNTTTASKGISPLSLKEMVTKVHQQWTNRILFLKTIRKPFQQATGLMTLIIQEEEEEEEREGKSSEGESTTSIVLPLALWNYLPLDGNDSLTSSSASLEKILPVNSYIALLHPLLVPNTLWDNKKDSIMIRCDNPETVRIFNCKEEWEMAQQQLMDNAESSSFFSTPRNRNGSLAAEAAVKLKDLGNDAFGKKDLILAMRYYKRAVDACCNSNSSNTSDDDEEKKKLTISCLGNLAETCLQLGYYQEAEQHARTILQPKYDPNHFKAKFCLARALIRLNHHHHQGAADEAKTILMDLRTQHPEHAASVQPILGECLQVIMESKKGRYNLSKMLGEESLSPVLPSFHANYVSPKVELGVDNITRKSDGGTYRGVLAKEDIIEGTLLTASKAFAFSYQNKKQQQQQYPYHQRSNKQHLYEVSQVHQAVSKLRKCSHTEVEAFYRLEAGGEVPTDTVNSNNGGDSKLVVDLPKIRSILESNRFGVDISNPASPFVLKVPPTDGEDGGEDEFVGVGLWLDVSMYNHSCTPNCTWAQIGDHMFVYACKDIPKGNELCISYVHPALSYKDRVEKFAKWSGGKGFVCGCEWCHWLRTSPPILREMNEEVKMAQMRMGSGVGVSSIDDLISIANRDSIRKAHEGFPLQFQQTIYNICMMEALQAANTAHDRHAARDAVKAATELGYAIRGGLRQETRIQDLCCLAAAHMTCDEDEEAEAALREFVKYQLILPSLTDFQNAVLLSSIQIWNPYQGEDFMKRFASLIQKIWQQRSKELK